MHQHWHLCLFRLFSTVTILLTLVLAEHPAGLRMTRRHGIRNASLPPAVGRSSDISPRDGSRFTYYKTGLGACGKYNEPSDFIVALNSAWDGGAHCFAWITITINGKSTHAQIVDECPGCPYLGLDFSSGLFQFFAVEAIGVIFGSWSFSPSASPSSTSQSSHLPPPTSHMPKLQFTEDASARVSTYHLQSIQTVTPTNISALDRPGLTQTQVSTQTPSPIRASILSVSVTSHSPSVASSTTESPSILATMNVIAVHMGQLIVAAAQATH